ncbi:MAG: hypothetical protein RI564_11245 [Gracilimonas sp.]|nr:hypothetical protein [Gracilimonas sp.]
MHPVRYTQAGFSAAEDQQAKHQKKVALPKDKATVDTSHAKAS